MTNNVNDGQGIKVRVLKHRNKTKGSFAYHMCYNTDRWKYTPSEDNKLNNEVHSIIHDLLT